MSQLPAGHLDEEHLDEEDIDGIGFRELASTLWSGRSTIIAAIASGFLVAVIHLHTAVYTYTATLTLVPVQSQVQSTTSHYSGLASLAGIHLGQGESISPFTEYPKVIMTKEVAKDLIEHNPELMEKIFGAQWDAQTNRWREPRSLLRPIVRAAKFILGIPVYSWHPPGSTEMQAFIAKNVTSSEDALQPILTLSFTAPDPDFAKMFLAELNESTDRVLRRISLGRSSKYAAYLEKKLASVQTTDLRQVLMESLSAQETLIMMGSSDTSFAVQEIGGPTTPIRPNNPQPISVILFGILLGAMSGGVLAYRKILLFEKLKMLTTWVWSYWRAMT